MTNYNNYLKSPQWEHKRKLKLKQTHYQCEICGSAKNLHVHHITYKNLNEKGWGKEDLDDLATICEKCHSQTHYVDNYKKRYKQETESNFIIKALGKTIVYYLLFGILITAFTSWVYGVIYSIVVTFIQLVPRPNIEEFGWKILIGSYISAGTIYILAGIYALIMNMIDNYIALGLIVFIALNYGLAFWNIKKRFPVFYVGLKRKIRSLYKKNI